MTISRLSVITLVAVLAAGCVDRNRSATVEPQSGEPAAEVATVSAGDQPLRELLEHPANPEAFPLAPGSSVRGTITAPSAGSIAAVAFQIGNYANTSDGHAEIELCEQQRCVIGEAELKGSQDNAYLLVQLQQPLSVGAAGTQLSYRFSKLGGGGPVALWLYQAPDAASAIKVNDSDALERTPKIALQYVP